jgi:RecA-family ATPase
LGEGGMKNFDQWTEELSKAIFVQTEEDQTEILSRLNEMADEDYEEE